MDIPRVTPRQVVERLGGGEPVTFVDARPLRALAEALHEIPGSRPISGDAVERRADDLPRRGVIVVYCTAPDETASAQVAARLRELGFAATFVLAGGFAAWEQARLPVRPLRRGEPATNSAQHQPM